ncbi:MAG: hypothetical protein R3284_00960 [Rubricoccaceae bacterium]|nr:hypothetical protein [Rubricoccaceae bacterium]
MSTDVIPEDFGTKERPEVMLDFDPSVDGFSFPNMFAWTDEDLNQLVRELRPLMRLASFVVPTVVGNTLGRRPGLLAGMIAGGLISTSAAPDRLLKSLAGRWSTFGLCGGMALRAKQAWLEKGGARTNTLGRDEIRADLRKAQSETIRASWAQFLRYWLEARFLSLMRQPVHPDPELLAVEMQKIQRQLDRGIPSLLGLVGDTPDPFATHQVVVFGLTQSLEKATLHVYDPNCPGRTMHIWVRRDDEGASISTDMSAGPKKSGGYHISKAAGTISMLFTIDL